MSLIIVTGVISTREKLRTSTWPFKYIYSCRGVEQEAGGRGHTEMGECRKNTEANKQSQVRAVIRQEARAYHKWCLKKKLEITQTLFPNRCDWVPSVGLFLFIKRLFHFQDFSKYYFFFLPISSPTYCNKTSRYGSIRRKNGKGSAPNAHTRTDFRVAASPAKYQVSKCSVFLYGSDNRQSWWVQRQPVLVVWTVYSRDSLQL